MSKKKSIIVLSLVAVFIILMAVFAVVDFPIGNTVYDYHGYAKTIKLGLDMSGGVSAVFNVIDDGHPDLDVRIDGTVASLQELLVSKGYTEATVTKGTNSNGLNTIRVEVPDVDDPETVLSLIGRPATLEFKLEESDTAEAVIIGSEGRGVSRQALERCQKTLKIPMRERCESLNAAVAAAVVLWEMAR